MRDLFLLPPGAHVCNPRQPLCQANTMPCDHMAHLTRATLTDVPLFKRYFRKSSYKNITCSFLFAICSSHKQPQHPLHLPTCHEHATIYRPPSPPPVPDPVPTKGMRHVPRFAAATLTHVKPKHHHATLFGLPSVHDPFALMRDNPVD